MDVGKVQYLGIKFYVAELLFRMRIFQLDTNNKNLVMEWRPSHLRMSSIIVMQFLWWNIKFFLKWIDTSYTAP